METKEKLKDKLGMYNYVVVIAFFICAVLLGFWQLRWPTGVIEIKGQELSVLMSKTEKHLVKGLGGRESLEPHDGMLFVFPWKRDIGIVMRDMKFPIDIIWIDEGKIVDIAPNVQIEPGRTETELSVYYPRLPAKAVLELPAGWAREHELKIGDEVRMIRE